MRSFGIEAAGNFTRPLAELRRDRRLRKRPFNFAVRLTVRVLIHQPSYSLLNRWIEGELLSTLDEMGVGCIAFSPLAQGMLSGKYLTAVPADARAAKGGSFSKELITEENIRRVRGLNAIAQERGQTLAQMAIAWVLRDPRVTSALVGARTVEQLADTLRSLEQARFTDQELRAMDEYATEGRIDLWKETSQIEGHAKPR